MSKSSLRGWLRSLARPRPAPRRRPQARLSLERFEERDVPSSSIPLNGFTWTPIGPSPIADGQSPGNPSSTGRLNGVAFDPVVVPGRSYPFPKGELFPNGGVSVGFHGGSHHQDDPVQIKRYADLNRYHVSTLAYFAEKLKAIPDGEGTLLDHSLIMYGTNMGNSNQHLHFDVPHILVGGANGQLKGNRHLAYERKTTPTGNLLLSVLDMYGIHQQIQGDSIDRLAKLL